MAFASLFVAAAGRGSDRGRCSGLLAAPLAVPPVRTVLSGGRGPALVAVLKTTGLAELVSAVGLAAGLVLATIV